MPHCSAARVSAVALTAVFVQLAVKVAKAAQQVRRSSQVHSALAIAAMRNAAGMEDDDDDEVGMAYGCAVVVCVWLCVAVCGCVWLCVCGWVRDATVLPARSSPHTQVPTPIPTIQPPEIPALMSRTTKRFVGARASTCVRVART